jgi:hypothetical protein
MFPTPWFIEPEVEFVHWYVSVAPEPPPSMGLGLAERIAVVAGQREFEGAAGAPTEQLLLQSRVPLLVLCMLQALSGESTEQELP